MAKTISQRITLEGSEDIRKKLEELGKTGEQAFKKLQDAAKKPITDPAQIDKTGKAIDELVKSGTKLSQQFEALTTNARQFGTAGAQASQQTTIGLQQTNTAVEKTGAGFRNAANEANNLGIRIGVVSGLVQAATNKLLSALNTLRTQLAPSALLEGLVETGKIITEQAEKVKLSIPEWLALRKAIRDSSISNEDFVKSGGKIADTMEKAQGGIARLGSGTEQTVKVGEKFITIYRGGAAVAGAMQSEADKAATSLRKMGASGEAIARGDTLRAMREVAQNISKIPDSLKRAEAGTAAFGKNWEAMTKVLLSTQQVVDRTTASLAELGRANRDMTAEQIAKSDVLKIKWADLEQAIRAVKDRIGAVFLDPALARTEWLTKLIDGASELLRRWLLLGNAKRRAFMEDLGETPTEIAFKILIAVGQQLAGIWRDVLVPAGNQLVNIVKQISSSMEGISKSQVAAFFITATIAAVGLTIALKAIGLALTPLSLLLGLFTGFGPLLIALGIAAFVFWDELVAGAEKALALIPNSLRGFQQAFAALFAGDFSGFWTLFSASATTAFQTIRQAILQTEGVFGDFARAIAGEGAIQTPWVQTLVDGLKQIATDGPAAIKLIAQGFIALGNAATSVANIINRIFGTKLTGTDIALIAIVLQLTGGFVALAAIVTIVAGSLAAFLTTLQIGATLFRGLALIVGGPVTIALVALGVALVAIIAYWPQISAAATQAWNAVVSGAQTAKQWITDWVTTPVADAWNWIKTTFGEAIDWVMQKASDAAAYIASLLTASPVQGGSTGAPAAAPQGFVRGGFVGGRGSGTSDSNLAWVSRGEHIMPARAVRQPGVLAFLEALRRSGGDLSRALDGLRGFALGGLVPAMPTFATGGLNSMSNVTIQFPGMPAIGGLRAPADVVEELRKAATMAQVRSGGRKPSRYS